MGGRGGLGPPGRQVVLDPGEHDLEAVDGVGAEVQVGGQLVLGDDLVDQSGALDRVTELGVVGLPRDRGPKRRGYAAADIPLYLLTDRLEDKATIFSEPRGDDYAHIVSVALGEDLPIPAPLEGVLPTRDF